MPHPSSTPWVHWASATLLAVALAAPASAQSLDLWGSFASGSARECPSGLCSGSFIERPQAGGLGQTSAAVALSPEAQALHPGVTFAAQASLVGALAIPELKAMAVANAATRYTTNAQAEAVQAYVYTGAVASSFVLDVFVSGSVTGDASLSGFVIVYDSEGYKPGSEVPGTRLDNTSFFWSAASQAQPAPLEFTLQPGDSVYLQATLFAGADSRNIPSAADAFHTLTMSFQNPANLVQAAALVPEPASWALMLLGGAALLRARRGRV
jgi:hypothetical protein